jgi:hypothetical protein
MRRLSAAFADLSVLGFVGEIILNLVEEAVRSIPTVAVAGLACVASIPVWFCVKCHAFESQFETDAASNSARALAVLSSAPFLAICLGPFGIMLAIPLGIVAAVACIATFVAIGVFASQHPTAPCSRDLRLVGRSAVISAVWSMLIGLSAVSSVRG